jgi:uncharacterized protein (TIGR03437 family)
MNKRNTMPKLEVLFKTSVILLASAAVMHAATTISPSPASVVTSYVKSTKVSTPGIVKISLVNGTTPLPTGTVYVSIDKTTMPIWLQSDIMNGTGNSSATGAVTFKFTASPLAETLIGSLTATVSIKGQWTGQVAPLTPVNVQVTLTVTAGAPQLSAVLTSSTGSFAVAQGATAPIATLVVSSSSDPISFSATVSTTTLGATLSAKAGAAYSFGSKITVTFSQGAFDNAVPGSFLSASITLTAPNAANPTLIIPINWSISAAAATVSTIFPNKLPKVIENGGTRIVNITGTNFVSGMDVHVGSGSALFNDCTAFPNVTVEALCIQNSTSLYVRVTAADLFLIVSGSDLTISVGSTPALPTVTITAAPFINSIADAAALRLVLQTGSPASLDVSPYEILTIFGENFTTKTMLATPSPFNFRYPKVLNDGTGAAGDVIVQFTTDSACTTPVTGEANAYLLMASPTQINLMVPSALSAAGNYWACVKYGDPASPVPSNAAPLRVTATLATPALFTFNGGTGQGAIVNSDGTINGSATMGKISTATATYAITLYMSGLGAPVGGIDLASIPGTLPTGFPALCASPTSFLIAANADNSPFWAELDGAVIGSKYLPAGIYPPCLDLTKIAVSIGTPTVPGSAPGSAGTLILTNVFSGWVADSVAGLYQVIVNTPLSIPVTGVSAVNTTGTANQYNVTVSVGGTVTAGVLTGTFVSSPLGATVYIK